MTLEKGWLDKQFSKVAEEIKEWPDWMQREAGFKTEHPKPGTAQGTASQSCPASSPDSREEPAK